MAIVLNSELMYMDWGGVGYGVDLPLLPVTLCHCLAPLMQKLR